MKIASPILLVVAMLGLAANSAGQYFPESDAEEGWRKNTDPDFVRSLGLDPEHVEGFGGYNMSIKNAQIGTSDYGKHKGALLIKDGWIVGEWYNRPDGASFKNYLSSVGKTLALACFGIMVRDGMSGAIDYKIDRNSKLYDKRWFEAGFPLSDPGKTEITFDHVFRHTSGICPQKTADGVIVERGRNHWTDYASWVVGRDRRWPQTSMLYFTPGVPQQYPGRERWGAHEGVYSSVAFAHIGLVISEVYGMPAYRFLWRRLLKPLGFSGLDFHNPPQPPDIRWFTAGGLRITTRDFARFAYFLLHEGLWENEQMVPEGWIESFTSTPYYPNLRSNVDGYFGEQYPKDMFRVFGSGGNFAFIVPGYNLIAVRTGRINNFFMDALERDLLRRLFLVLPGYLEQQTRGP